MTYWKDLPEIKNEITHLKQEPGIHTGTTGLPKIQKSTTILNPGRRGISLQCNSKPGSNGFYQKLCCRKRYNHHSPAAQGTPRGLMSILQCFDSTKLYAKCEAVFSWKFVWNIFYSFLNMSFIYLYEATCGLHSPVIFTSQHNTFSACTCKRLVNLANLLLFHMRGQ